jgi:hypothetical protein
MVHILKKKNGQVIVIGKIKGIDMNLILKNRVIKARRALSDKKFLSFKKGQEFYVLSYNEIDKTYFVTTDYQLPFSRNSGSGIVPIIYFNSRCVETDSVWLHTV